MESREFVEGGFYNEIEYNRVSKFLKWSSPTKVKMKLSHSTLCTHYEDFEPIPLTKEWLLRLGFKKCLDNWFTITYFTDCQEAAEVMEISYNLTSGRVALVDADEDETRYPAYTKKPIKNVHELQNLYNALTGEELTTTVTPKDIIKDLLEQGIPIIKS